MWKGSLKGFPWICTNFISNFCCFFIFSHGFQKHVITIHPYGISSPSLYVCFEDSSCWEFVPGLAGNSEKSNCRYWILKTSFRHHNRICSRMLTKPDKGNKGEHWGGKMGVWLDQEESGWVAQGDTSFLSIARASRMVVDHKHVWRDMYISLTDCSLNNFQFALRWDFYFSFKTEYFVWLLDLLLDGKERAK